MDEIAEKSVREKAVHIQELLMLRVDLQCLILVHLLEFNYSASSDKDGRDVDKNS